LANFYKIIELFTQKIVTKLSKIWVMDPRSGIRKKPLPDPGSRIQGSKRSRIRIRNTEQNIQNTQKSKGKSIPACGFSKSKKNPRTISIETFAKCLLFKKNHTLRYGFINV
jgi:hypothetical protein